MFYFFMFLWLVFSIATFVGLIYWMFKRRHGKRVLLSLGLSVACLISGVALNANELQTAVTDQENNAGSQNIDENGKEIYIDVTKFSNITPDELAAIKGDPDKIDEWTFKLSDTKSHEAITYIYDGGNQEFLIMGGKVVRFTLYGTGQTYDDHIDAMEMFGIKPNPYMTKEAETPIAFRYRNVADGIDDFWMLEEEKGQIGTLKITFDNSYFELKELELLEHSTESDGYSNYVVGRIINNSNRSYALVSVEITLFDSEGNQVGSTLDTTSNLQPGTTWKFKAPIIEDDADSYRIDNIIGY